MTNEETKFTPDYAVLVAVEVRGSRPQFSLGDSLDELALLADTAGVVVRGRVTQKVSRIDPATFIGPGKIEEIAALLPEVGADVVIFDDELSPRHQRELEKALGEKVRVVDRSALILDIFAQHARTREGALQVELAQYEYRLPRLTRQWTHLARQAGGGAGRGGTGGVGLRGPGETQLEADRREIGRKITRLKRELDSVRAHRQRHRLQRLRAGIPMVALVGYTNAGKSTLLNALAGSDVYVADQLFATLDPTTRRVTLPAGRAVLFSDTVGFIQKLPVALVAAFRATLEEISEADLLLHVVDGAQPHLRDQIDVVEDTLAELDATRIPRVLVLNKADQVESPPDLDLSEWNYQEAVRVSALHKTGLDDLLDAVNRALLADLVPVSVLVPYSRGEWLAVLRSQGVIEQEKSTEQGTEIMARVSRRLAGRLMQGLARSEHPEDEGDL